MVLASQERMEKVKEKEKDVEKLKDVMKEYSVEPEEVNDYLEEINSAALFKSKSLSQLLLRPNVELTRND